jgi:hypothetical protein
MAEFKTIHKLIEDYANTGDTTKYTRNYGERPLTDGEGRAIRNLANEIEMLEIAKEIDRTTPDES